VKKKREGLSTQRQQLKDQRKASGPHGLWGAPRVDSLRGLCAFWPLFCTRLSSPHLKPTRMCRPFPPPCAAMDDVRDALKALLEGMDALHRAGGAHGRLNPSYLAGTADSASPCCLGRVVCPRGRVLVERSGGRWHVMLPAHNPQAPCPLPLSSPPACVRRGGDEATDPSLWYRAPELQVRSIEEVLCRSGGRAPDGCETPDGCERHSAASAADVWAAGCMFGEMAGDGTPLFHMAETEFQLLSAHCDYTGYTYKSDEIEISSEPRRGGVGESDDEGQREYSLRDLVPSLCDCGLDLLSRMLCGDWRERITMAEALEHDFFTGGCQCTFRVSPPPLGGGGCRQVSRAAARVRLQLVCERF